MSLRSSAFRSIVHLALLSAPAVFASPPIDPNPVVVSGQVGFSGLESPHAVITQESARAIVDYNHFNILPGGSVQFLQPGSDATILNRITGATPSLLEGSLTANGQVYFVNPAGVTFGEGSIIRADTFLAAAGQMTNEDFLAGNLQFSLSGAVENLGSIETRGLTGLFGQQVLNAGEIVSRDGVAVLSSGDKVYLQPVGSSLAVEVSRSSASTEGVGIDNSGGVSGDEVLFSAGDAYAVALNHSGSVRASRAARLHSDGGTIEVSGEIVSHGGRVEIGGTDRGGPEAVRARETHITESALIDVSGGAEGSGGHVVVWADERTRFRGTIEGAGAAGADGAFVEISAADVDMGEDTWNIFLGRGGHLLFDPVDIVIGASQALNIRHQMDAGTDVTIDTNLPGAGNGDITVAAPILTTNMANAAKLTLNASRDIIIDQYIVNDQRVIGGDIFSFTAGRNIVVNADVLAGLGGESNLALNAISGSVTINDIIDAGANSITIQAATGVTLETGSQIISGTTLSAGNSVRIDVPDGTMHFNGGLIQGYGGTDIIISAKRLLNDTGSNAIANSGGVGFWQIALPHPYGETFETNQHKYGGLVSNNPAVYNSSGTAAPQRREYHYAFQPVIQVTAHDDAKTYGDSPNAGYAGSTIHSDGLIDAAAYGNVFASDSVASSISGSVTLTSAGGATTAGAGSYDIVPSGLSSPNGYGFDYVNGTLTVTPRPVTLVAGDQEKYYGDALTYDSTNFTVRDQGVLGASTLPNGETIDTVSLNSANGHNVNTASNVGTYTDEIEITGQSGAGGFSAANYTFTYVPGDLTINRRPITVTADQQQKYYGSSVTLSDQAFSVTDLTGGANLPNGETLGAVSVESKTGRDTSTISAAATYAGDLEITGLSGQNGFSVSNYDISLVDGDFVIAPRPITLTANDRTKDYGDSLMLGTTGFTLTDLDGDSFLPNSETITQVTLTSSNDVAGSTLADAGTYTDAISITGQSGGNGFNAANYEITRVDGDLVIDRRAITVTANGQNKYYGDTLDLGTTAFSVTDRDGGSALPHGEQIDTVTLTSVSGVDNSTTHNAGTYADEILPSAAEGSNGFDNANYAITFVEGDLVVDRRPVTLTALQQEKTYGNAMTLDGSSTYFSVADKGDPADSVLPNGEAVTSVLLQSATGVDSSTTASATTHADEINIVGQSGTFNPDNYDFSHVAGPLVVNQRPITLTARTQNRDYGDSLTLDGNAFDVEDFAGGPDLPNGEIITSVSLSSKNDIATTTTAGARTYSDEIEITGQAGDAGFDAANYDITYVDGDLVVDRRAITVTANGQNKYYGDTLDLGTTAFSVTDRDGGSALPHGEQIDTVTLTSASGVDNSTTHNAGTYADEILPSAAEGSNGFDNANYAITFVEGDLVVDRRPVTLTALQQEKTYGNGMTLDGTRFAVADKGVHGDSDLPNGEQVVSVRLNSKTGAAGSTSAAAGTYLGEIEIIDLCDCVLLSSSNYEFTYVAGPLVVSPRAVILTALTQNKHYGDTLTLDGTAFAVTDLDGDAVLPNGETVDAVTLLSQTGVDASTTANVSSYTDEIQITGQSGSNGWDADNYVISYVDGDLNVDARPIEVIASRQNKVYGDGLTLDGTAFTVLDKDGDALLPNGERIDLATLVSKTGIDASTTASAGTYTDEIRPTGVSGSNGFAHSNYAISFVDGNLVVDPRAVTLTASEQSRIYGNSLSLDNTAFTLTDKDNDAILPNGERINTVILQSATGAATATNRDAGTYASEIVITGQEGSDGFNPANYTFTYESGRLTITPRAITLTAENQAKAYGDAHALGSTAFRVRDLDGDGVLPNGERITGANLTSRNGVATSTTSDVGTYNDEIRITGQNGTNGFKASNYAISYVDGDFRVDPRSINVIASRQDKDYGDPLELDGTAFTVLDKDGDGMLPNGETIILATLVSREGVASSTTAGAATYSDEIRATGVSGDSGFKNSNYDITFVDGDLVVHPRAVTLTALEQQKIYGSALGLDGTAFSILDKDGDAGLPNGERIDRVLLSSATGADSDTSRNAGRYGHEIVIDGQSGSNGFEASNYDLTYVDGDLVVSRRAVTLSANAQAKVYGDALTLDGTAFSVTDLDGGSTLPNGETITTVALRSRNAVDGSTTANAGSYADEIRITGQEGVHGFDPDNYTFTYVDGDLIVTPRAVTVTAMLQDKTYGDTLVLDGSAISVLDKDGDGLLPNGESIVSANLVSRTGVDSSTTAGVRTYSGEIRPTSVVGSGGFDTANYAITFVDGDLRVDPRQVTLTAGDQGKIYGETLSLDGTAFTILDKDGDAVLPNDERIHAVAIHSATGVDGSTTSGVGTYDGEIVISGQSGADGFDPANYVFTYVNGGLVVTPRPITLSALAQSKTYGDTLALDTSAFSVRDLHGGSTLPNGEQIAAVSLESAAANAGTAPVGTYVDDLNITGQSGTHGFDAANYAISYERGDFVVSPRPITLMAHDQDRAFYAPWSPVSSAFTLVDADGGNTLPNGEQVDTVTLESVGGIANNIESLPGIYPENLHIAGQHGSNGFDAGNYLISYLPGDLEISGSSAPPSLMSEAFEEVAQEHSGAFIDRLLQGPPFFSLQNSLVPLFGNPLWDVLTADQREWLLREYERIPAGQINAALLQELLSKAVSR